MDHTKINIHSLSRWLIQNFIAFVRRHPFFSSSVAVHVIVLYLLYTYGSYTVDLQEHQQASVEVVQSLQKAQQTEMQKRIDDMEKIKRLLEKSANRPVTDISANTPSDQVESSAPKSVAPQTSEQLLAKATAMAQSINAIRKDIKAEELAKLLNIPKEEALKKVEERIAAEQAKEKAKKPEQAEATVKQLESEARSALEERKKELDAKKDGTKVALMPSTQIEQQNKDGAGESKRGEGSKGNGEHGNADGGGNQQSANSGGEHGNGGGNLTDASAAKNNIAGNQFHSQEIEHFLVESSYNMGAENNFFDAARGNIPEVRGSERKQAGRIIGAGGDFAERVYLNSWYVIGPFKGNSHGALYNNPSYPPEQLVDLDAVYFGKNERILKWQYVASGEYPFVPPDLAEDAVYYGYTELAVEHAQDLWMWCGADDDLQVWLNEHLVWAGGNIAKQNFFDNIYSGDTHHRKNWNLSEGKRRVHFQQGNNKLLFKLSNGPNRVGIFASIILTQ